MNWFLNPFTSVICIQSLKETCSRSLWYSFLSRLDALSELLVGLSDGFRNHCQIWGGCVRFSVSVTFHSPQRFRRLCGCDKGARVWTSPSSSLFLIRYSAISVPSHVHSRAKCCECLPGERDCLKMCVIVPAIKLRDGRHFSRRLQVWPFGKVMNGFGFQHGRTKTRNNPALRPESCYKRHFYLKLALNSSILQQ